MHIESQSGWFVHGHDWVKTMLQRHIEHDSVRHAYLFCGLPGIGKRSLALNFAQALNCLSPRDVGIPCGECRMCRQILLMQHADMVIVEPSENGASIKVEQIRALQHRFALTAVEAKYRIALLRGFDAATLSAQNALLKTLEEAPRNAILLLTAESEEKLLPTIVSRCEILRLQPLAVSKLEHVLQKHYQVEAALALELAHLSAGRLGYALQLQQQPEQVALHYALLDDLLMLLSEKRVGRFAYIEELSRGRDKNKSSFILDVWLAFWRDVLLLAMQPDALILHPAHRDVIETLAMRIGLFQTRQFLLKLQKARQDLSANVNMRLLFEVLMLDLPQVKVDLT